MATKKYQKAKKMFQEQLPKDFERNPKSFYAYLRSKTKLKHTVHPLVNSEGNTVSSEEEISSILNDYFDSWQIVEVKNIVNQDSGHIFNSINITVEDINQRINKLATNKG
jgi:hypothetical protein